MSRPLGSFNNRVNLPQHREDHRPVRPERVAALQRTRIPEERGGTSGGQVFANSRVRGEQQRYAGNALNVDLKSSTLDKQTIRLPSGGANLYAPPLGGAAESRTTAQYSQLPDAYYNT